MEYLVDTDVLIDVAKGKAGAADYLDSLGTPWSLSVITAMELLVGANNTEDVGKIDKLVSVFRVVTRNQKHFRMIPALPLEVPEY